MLYEISNTWEVKYMTNNKKEEEIWINENKLYYFLSMDCKVHVLSRK